MKGALKNKTTILVTHQIDFLHNVDLILVSIQFLSGTQYHCKISYLLKHSVHVYFIISCGVLLAFDSQTR